MRKDRRERRLAAMTNEPNVMREVRAHPANHPPLRARARAPSWFLSVDASSRRRVRRTARSRLTCRRPGAGPRPDPPPFPPPRPTPRPLLPAQNTHPIKVDKYGNYVRRAAPPVKSSVPPSDVRGARPRPPLDRPWSAAPSAAGTLPPTHRHPRHPKAPTALVLRGAHRRVVPLALLPSRFRTRGRPRSEVALAPEASARDVAPPPASASIARAVSASPSPVSDAPLHAESSRAGVLRGWPTRDVGRVASREDSTGVSRWRAPGDEGVPIALRERDPRESRRCSARAREIQHRLHGRYTRRRHDPIRRRRRRRDRLSGIRWKIFGEKNFPADDKTRGGEDAARGGSAKASAPFVGSAKASAPFVSTLAGAAGTAPAVTISLTPRQSRRNSPPGARRRVARSRLSTRTATARSTSPSFESVSPIFSSRRRRKPPSRCTRRTRIPPSAAYRARRSRLRFSHPLGGPRDGSRGGGGDSRRRTGRAIPPPRDWRRRRRRRRRGAAP